MGRAVKDHKPERTGVNSVHFARRCRFSEKRFNENAKPYNKLKVN